MRSCLYKRRVKDQCCAVVGVGLDFSSASTVIFAELPSEVALLRQGEDRAHRKGQTMPVNVYFLIARGTNEDRRHALVLLLLIFYAITK